MNLTLMYMDLNGIDAFVLNFNFFDKLLKSVPGDVRKLFAFCLVKSSDNVKFLRCLHLPIIDFTPLSFSIVFEVHLRERFRTKTA